VNITVIAGQLSRPPERRVLPSGDELVELDVTVARPGERAESVPVVWPAAPPRATELAAGEAVVVVGRVRRRFFRAGGRTQSRTEVVADGVVPARRAAAARKLVAAAGAALDECGEASTARVAVRRTGRTAQAADAV
jgi:single-strand DNA-binding protein